MQKQFTRTGNPAFRQGLLFSILLGLFSIVFNVILSLAGLSTLFIGAVITLMYAFVFYATKGPSPTIAPPLSAMVFNAILSIPVTLLFGAGIGALGGLLRKR